MTPFRNDDGERRQILRVITGDAHCLSFVITGLVPVIPLGVGCGAVLSEMAATSAAMTAW